MLKLLGSVFILMASIGGSLFFLNRFKEQERQLLMVKELLVTLEKQLEFVRLPIAEVIEDMAKKAGEPFEKPLLEFMEVLSQNQTENIEHLWRETYQKYRQEFFLSREEFELLLDVGRLLEPVDSKSQIASIELYKSRADDKIQKIWEERGNKQKVYQSVCFLGGLILIIVLL